MKVTVQMKRDNIPLIQLATRQRINESDLSDIDTDFDKSYRPTSKYVYSTSTEYMSDVSKGTQKNRKEKDIKMVEKSIRKKRKEQRKQSRKRNVNYNKTPRKRRSATRHKNSNEFKL